MNGDVVFENRSGIYLLGVAPDDFMGRMTSICAFGEINIKRSGDGSGDDENSDAANTMNIQGEITVFIAPPKNIIEGNNIRMRRLRQSHPPTNNPTSNCMNTDRRVLPSDRIFVHIPSACSQEGDIEVCPLQVNYMNASERTVRFITGSDNTTEPRVVIVNSQDKMETTSTSLNVQVTIIEGAVIDL